MSIYFICQWLHVCLVLLLGYFDFGGEIKFIDWCCQLLIDFSFDAFTYQYYNATITIIIIITIFIKRNFTFCILVCQYFVCFLFFIFVFIAMQLFYTGTSFLGVFAQQYFEVDLINFVFLQLASNCFLIIVYLISYLWIPANN